MRPNERKKNHPLRSPRKEAIFRRLAAIEFQSSKASETNGPIFETTTKLQPFRHEILPILLLFPPRRYTRHRNARLERDSHCPFVRGGQRTRRSGYVVPRLFQTWRTRRRTASPFDKERVERFDPFFFFFSPPPFPFSVHPHRSKVRILVSGRGKLPHAIL